VHFVSTMTIYYEMMPQGVTKGTALKELARLLDIPLEHTIVIGDYFNDIDMMREAGYSVAMGNAPAEVKRKAHQLAESNRYGGVGHYLYGLVKAYEG
jgi:hydroxymethylpyrimidine pyrophosphatase-like HAD family hydrolase